MAKVKLSDAPGCIGSPLIRSENHPICRNCLFTNICDKLASRNADRLKLELGIATLSKQTGKKLMKGAQKMSIAQLENAAITGKRPLTSKGREISNSMVSKTKDGVSGIMKALANSNRVHVEHGLQFVKPSWAGACLMLMWDNGGKLNKKDLRDFLHRELGFCRLTATSSVSNFVNAATNMDLIIEIKEQLRIANETSG